MLEETVFRQARRLLLLILPECTWGDGSYVVSINRGTVPDDLRTSVFNTRW